MRDLHKNFSLAATIIMILCSSTGTSTGPLLFFRFLLLVIKNSLLTNGFSSISLVWLGIASWRFPIHREREREIERDVRCCESSLFFKDGQTG